MLTCKKCGKEASAWTAEHYSDGVVCQDCAKADRDRATANSPRRPMSCQTARILCVFACIIGGILLITALTLTVKAIPTSQWVTVKNPSFSASNYWRNSSGSTESIGGTYSYEDTSGNLHSANGHSGEKALYYNVSRPDEYTFYKPCLPLVIWIVGLFQTLIPVVLLIKIRLLRNHKPVPKGVDACAAILLLVFVPVIGVIAGFGAFIAGIIGLYMKPEQRVMAGLLILIGLLGCLFQLYLFHGHEIRAFY